MGELTWQIDEVTGQLVVEGLAQDDAPALVGDLLGAATLVGCAKPIAMLPPSSVLPSYDPVQARISGYYHDSLVEGPGRRSVVRFQGCPIRCHGCWVPETWSVLGGESVPVATLALALVDPAFERDGVTILGGEPFAQIHALWSLVVDLNMRGPLQIMVYSGFTYDALLAREDRRIREILELSDILVDGPYVERLAPGGPWTGSRNQRVIDLRATRQNGQVTLYGDTA